MLQATINPYFAYIAFYNILSTKKSTGEISKENDAAKSRSITDDGLIRFLLIMLKSESYVKEKLREITKLGICN